MSRTGRSAPPAGRDRGTDDSVAAPAGRVGPATRTGLRTRPGFAVDVEVAARSADGAAGVVDAVA